MIAVTDRDTLPLTPAAVDTTNMFPPGTLTLTLKRGEVVQLIAAYARRGTADLTGSLVQSNAPIAVFSGHNCAYVPDVNTKACNILTEQIPPMSTWGRTFGVGALEGRSRSTVRVLARHDSTQVTVNGAHVATLRGGEYHEQRHLVGDAIIITSRPSLVAQFSQGFDNGDNVGDPMMLLVPPMEQFDNVYAIATPALGSWRNYVNVIVRRDDVEDLRIDAHPVDQTRFRDLAGSEYVIGRIEISHGTHVVTGSAPFGLYQYGLGYDESAYDAYGNSGGQLYIDLDNLDDGRAPDEEKPDIGSLYESR